MSKFTIEQLEALKEELPSSPWEFQPWGAQNQNGDHDESVLMDSSGETIAYALSNSVGETVSRIPALVDALIAAETKLQQLKEQIEGLADWHDTKAMKARDFPWPGGQHAARFRGKAEAHETARSKLTQILEGQQ